MHLRMPRPISLKHWYACQWASIQTGKPILDIADANPERRQRARRVEVDQILHNPTVGHEHYAPGIIAK